MVPDPWTVINTFLEKNHDMNASPDELIHALEDAGFRIVSIHSTDWALGYD